VISSSVRSPGAAGDEVTGGPDGDVDIHPPMLAEYGKTAASHRRDEVIESVVARQARKSGRTDP
jgi:hypothetical protein